MLLSNLSLCVLLVVVEALCLALVKGVAAVLAVGVVVAILVAVVGLSLTTGLVLFSLWIAVFVDVSFRGGTWCRLGLRSRSLVPSFVGWSCRDFFI